MIELFLMFCKQVMCRHAPVYDGLSSGGESIIVRTRCVRCGKLEAKALTQNGLGP